jgi:hypothetical protein
MIIVDTQGVLVRALTLANIGGRRPSWAIA